jgi:hypothetical protein
MIILGIQVISCNEIKKQFCIIDPSRNIETCPKIAFPQISHALTLKLL